jgi:Ca2+-binding RTX toxin-like protein
MGASGSNNAISGGSGASTLFANGTSNTLSGGSGNDFIGVWWQATGIDPLKIARKLWKHTRVNEGRMRPDARRQDSALNCASQTAGLDMKPPR